MTAESNICGGVPYPPEQYEDYESEVSPPWSTVDDPSENPSNR